VSAKKKFMIVAAIAAHNAPSLALLEQATGIPAPTLKRQIGQLRSEYDMDIRFVAAGKAQGRVGYYHIYDWGILNRNEVLVRYMKDLSPVE
jgi:hypothetical protein